MLFRYDKRMHLKEDPLYSPSPDGIQIAVLYPNAYAFAMSNLGFHSLCRLVGETCGLTLERYFAESIKNNNVVSLESSFDLGRQSVLLVTINYEEDALLFLQFLKTAGIEPDRRARLGIGKYGLPFAELVLLVGKNL